MPSCSAANRPGSTTVLVYEQQLAAQVFSMAEALPEQPGPFAVGAFIAGGQSCGEA